jgi:hypothetical protein
MMRESEQTQRMKTQGDLQPERKTPLSTNSNIPLMSMTPLTTTTTNSSSTFYKDLTSTFFEQNSMPTSQTMPSLMRPTIVPQQQPIRPTINFSSSSSNKTDLTSSLLNNINSLGSRPQTAPAIRPMNSMNTNSSMPSPFFNSGTTNNTPLFQPPPPPGSTVIKGSTTVQSKSAASELDDLFN